MSTRGSRGAPLQGYVRNGRRRKMPLDVDLNVPPADNPSQEGTSGHSNTLDVQNDQQRASVLPVPIDVEAFDDDDVVISSPRAFAEAKNNFRRSRGSTVLVDVDPDGGAGTAAPSSRNKRRRVPANQAIINLEGSSKPMGVEEIWEVQTRCMLQAGLVGRQNEGLIYPRNELISQCFEISVHQNSIAFAYYQLGTKYVTPESRPVPL